MPKDRKRKDPVRTSDNNAAQKRNLRRLGILFVNFILFYLLFRLLLELSERTQMIGFYYATTIVYAGAAAGLFIAYYVLNGFSFDKTPRTWDELPEKWDDERKQEFLAKQPARREKAKSLLYLLMPILVTLLISYIELNFFG